MHAVFVCSVAVRLSPPLLMTHVWRQNVSYELFVFVIQQQNEGGTGSVDVNRDAFVRSRTDTNTHTQANKQTNKHAQMHPISFD